MFAIFLAMASGMAAADYITAPGSIVLGLTLILIITTYLLRKEGKLLPFSFILIIFVASFGYYQWIDEGNRSVIQGIDVFNAEMEGRIASEVKVDGDRARWIMSADTVNISSNNTTKRVDMGGEKVQVVVKLRTKKQWEEAHQWQRGTIVRLNGEWERPRKAGNPGALDYQLYLYREQIHWIINVDGVDSIRFAPTHYSGKDSIAQKFQLKGLRQFDAFREYLADQVETVFPPFSQGFMKGILLGTRDDLEPERLEAFSLLGLTHVLAISGMHVGLVIGGWIWLCLRFGMTYQRTLLLTLFVIPVYITLTGAEPSAIRAGIVTMLGITAVLMKRWKNGLSLLGFTGCLMLLWNPYFLFNIGFQLSFLTTAGILWGVPKMNKKLPIQNAWIRSAISITFIAQCFSFPITIYYFNQFSILSFGTNLFLVPVITLIILPFGYAALFLGMVHPGFGYILGKIVNSTLWGVYWSVDRLSDWEMLHQIWGTPPKWWVILYYVFFLWLMGLWVKGEDRIHPQVKLRWGGTIHLPRIDKHRWMISALIFIMILHLGYGYSYPLKRDVFQATFIDVGQGDSILIETPNGKRILVDGGGTLDFSEQLEEWQKRKKMFEVGKQTVVPYLKRNGIRHLDYVVATHGDMDHIGGLRAVLSELSVGNLVWGADRVEGSEETDLMHIARENKIKVVQAIQGQKWSIEEGIEMWVLHPARESGRSEKSNNQSVVLLLNVYGETVLLTGDIEKEGEYRILDMLEEMKFRPQIDIMKVAHHGSRTSTTERWVDFFQPSVAVISVGQDNWFGHPTKEVLQRLKAADTQIYRTDVDGAVRVTIDRKGQVNVKSTLQPQRIE